MKKKTSSGQESKASINNRNLERNRDSRKKTTNNKIKTNKFKTKQNPTKYQDSRNCTRLILMCLALRPNSSPVRQMLHSFLVTDKTNRWPWSKWLASIHILSNGECRGSCAHWWAESTVSTPPSCLQDKVKWLPLKTGIPRKTSTDSTTHRASLFPRGQDHRKSMGIITALDPKIQPLTK